MYLPKCQFNVQKKGDIHLFEFNETSMKQMSIKQDTSKSIYYYGNVVYKTEVVNWDAVLNRVGYKLSRKTLPSFFVIILTFLFPNDPFFS